MSVIATSNVNQISCLWVAKAREAFAKFILHVYSTVFFCDFELPVTSPSRSYVTCEMIALEIIILFLDAIIYAMNQINCKCRQLWHEFVCEYGKTSRSDGYNKRQVTKSVCSKKMCEVLRTEGIVKFLVWRLRVLGSENFGSKSPMVFFVLWSNEMNYSVSLVGLLHFTKWLFTRCPI